MGPGIQGDYVVEFGEVGDLLSKDVDRAPVDMKHDQRVALTVAFVIKSNTPGGNIPTRGRIISVLRPYRSTPKKE
jgi:hypothetical protein